MRWRKLGRIFCPSGEREWMRTHAAVPFAEHRNGDRFRVYFSSRDSQERSHVGWVEIDLKRPTQILAIADRPLLSPGPLGHFDDSGAMLSWIAQGADRSYAYYIGWNLSQTVPFRNALGVAFTTPSGNADRYSPGPILDRSPVDPCFVASVCVLPGQPRWQMWYLSCLGWEPTPTGARHRYHLKYASSVDGLNWHRDGRVAIDFASPSEYAISRPSVLRDGEQYRMWYSYRGTAYRIGYAESPDGIHWRRRDAETGIDVSPEGWDAEMIEYPHVFDHQGQRYMLYNGNGYGRTGFGLAVLEQG